MRRKRRYILEIGKKGSLILRRNNDGERKRENKDGELIECPLVCIIGE